MDDFRSQLRALIDEMVEAGTTPAFLLCDLYGAEVIKADHGDESLDKFKDAVIRAVVAAANGADAFTYGDDRVVAVLDGSWDRLKTFALIQKLRRQIPLLGQSFDCVLEPQFDVLEYDAGRGIGGLIGELTTRRNPDAA